MDSIFLTLNLFKEILALPHNIKITEQKNLVSVKFWIGWLYIFPIFHPRVIICSSICYSKWNWFCFYVTADFWIQFLLLLWGEGLANWEGQINYPIFWNRSVLGYSIMIIKCSLNGRFFSKLQNVPFKIPHRRVVSSCALR